MLIVESVSCVKQERCLFEDISFQVDAGDILQLEGQNGAGKTSLLRILSGFSMPEHGRILWREQDIHKESEAFLDELLVIGHKTGVNGQLSALENVAFWSETRGYYSPENTYELLAKLGLVGLEDMPVRMLSAGQQRRVALARLWSNDAAIWMLDEPFTAVDKSGVKLLQARFKEHLQSGGSIILTTHQDLTEHFPELKTLTLEYRF